MLMLKQRVVVQGPGGISGDQEGIVVAMIEHLEGINQPLCKVLVGNKISNWIPGEWMTVKQNYSFTA